MYSLVPVFPLLQCTYMDVYHYRPKLCPPPCNDWPRWKVSFLTHYTCPIENLRGSHGPLDMQNSSTEEQVEVVDAVAAPDCLPSNR